MTTVVKGITDRTMTDLDTMTDPDTMTDLRESLATTPLETLLEVASKTGEVVAVIRTAPDTEQKFPYRKQGYIRSEMVTLPCNAKQGHSRVFSNMFVALH